MRAPERRRPRAPLRMEGTQEETFELKEEEELRIEVGKDKQVTVTLLQGTAEVRRLTAQRASTACAVRHGP